MTRIRLKAGRVRPVWAGHPWVFAQAIELVDGAPGAGDVVTVVDPRGQALGRGYWSPRSAIPVRILSRDPEARLDEGFLLTRIEAAAERRAALLGLPNDETTGYRLVHAEGDGLPGLIVDVYGEVAVVQFGTIGMKRREDAIVGALTRVVGAHTVLEVPNAQAQRLEGFDAPGGILRGDDALEELRFRERGLPWVVPRAVAQKTGFYFDQRDNRRRVEGLARDRRVLDLFCYVGAFAMAAARGGARSVDGVDRSAPALAAASAALHHAGLEGGVKLTAGDVKRVLPELERDDRRFDLVVCDPPKLAPSARHLAAGKKAYRALNAAALRVVEPGGQLLTCSCSAALRPDDLLRTVALAARDAGREVAVLDLAGQASDHPTPPAFPEGRYLTAALLAVR
jgi:23S rRNA (cytosine1962-C5)-methyltransferase